MARSRDISKVLSSSTAVALDSELGLSLITPTSITATGGTGSIGATGAVTFSGCTAISLNGIFNSTYDNYKIIYQGTSSSAGAEVFIRFRASGTDNSSNLYYSNRQGSFAYNTGHFSSSTNPGTQSIGIVAGDFTTRGSLAVLEISSPFLTKGTFLKFISNWGYFNAHGSVMHDSTTQFDGISFYPNSGNETGIIRVYGYRN